MLIFLMIIMGCFMKKFSLFKKLFIFAILSLAICGVCSFSEKQNEVFAETECEYFTVTQYSGQSAIASISNGEVAYVTNSQTVKADFHAQSNISGENPIVHISYYFSFNGSSYTNEVLEQNGIKITYNGISLLIESTFDNGANPCGKYELHFDYTVTENGSQTTKSFDYTYYVLMETNYYNGTYVQYQFDNAFSPSNSSILYDRVFQYNYQNSNSNNLLPTLTINKKNITVEITKTFQKVTKTQNIWFDGTNLNTDNNLVSIVENPDNNLVSIIFNDLGTYTIKYNFIYTYGNNVDNLNPSSTNISKRTDMLEIFGYQLYYSDSETSDLKEFKTYTNGVIDDEYTDISFLTNGYHTSLNNTEESNLTNILAKISDKSLSIQQTNQAPVQFRYNVEIFNSENSTVVDTQSGYWQLDPVKLENNEYTVDNLPAKQSYDNRPITDSGIYIVKVVYKFYSSLTGSTDIVPTSLIGDDEEEHLFSQWFVFELTKETAQMSIKTQDNTVLLDGAYTNQSVIIKKDEPSTSTFNAKTKLVVYLQNNYSGNYVEVQTINSNEEFTATQNGRYIVTMYFGKNLSRSYSSTFTIDNINIENIQIFAVSKLENSNYYTRNNEIDFWTNQAVAVSWNNKASGSEIVAEYKFIPLVMDTSTNFTSTVLKQYYSYDAVPVEYYFDYNNTTLTSVTYQNSKDFNYIPSTNVLTEAGMYVFRIKDSAGNEQYFSFIIDTTSAKILQEVNGEYVEPSELNILSSDVTVSWGRYKVIKFNNLSYAGGNFNIADEWLKNVFDTTDIFSKYFTTMSINTVNTCFTISEINTNVLLSINGVSKFIQGTEENNYSYVINDKQENEYNFYIRDSVNTKTILGQDEISVNNYLKNYSGTHSLKISFDASLTELIYTKNNQQTYLSQDAYNPEASIDLETNYTKKDKFYIPTTINTLKDSNEILKLMFNPVPEEGIIEVESITYKFSEFASKNITNDTSSAYTYQFVESSEEYTIYSRSNPNENKSLTQENSMYIWEINKEYNPKTNSYQTKAGKYTITRTYCNMTGTQNKVSGSLDYMIRTLTFIVDRNGIITSPVVVDESSSTYSYVGESIKIQVLEEDNKMFFEDIYIASNNSAENTVILETNKLPVFVYIPVVKYGYSLTDGGTFNTENSINSYNPSDVSNSVIQSYALNAEIRYSFELSNIDQPSKIYYSSVGSNGYLKFYDEPEKSGITFTEIGYYKVTIEQGYLPYGANSFSFMFRITEEEPSFEVLNPTNNEELKYANNNYYTNQETIRLAWTDSSNEFMSIINKSAITYSVNGGESKTINPDSIQTNDRYNYVDLSLTDIGAYNNDSVISITMQFEGKESDYNAGKFKTTRTIVVDTVAPTKNINTLVSLTGINENLLRNVQQKYNTSVASGLYKYYAYSVDASNIRDLIDLTSSLNGDAYTILYRFFETTVNGNIVNTKYNDIYTQETSPSAVENSTNNFDTLDEMKLTELLSNQNSYNKYIEIVEKDLAGNITIYTIYLTNVNALADTNLSPIQYLNNNEQNYIFYNQLNSNIDIFAKSSMQLTKVDMMGFDWNRITVNGTSYLKTPYSNSKYYNLTTYDPTNPTKSAVDLTEFATLLANSQKQNIVIGLVPFYNTITLSASVLNTSLSVIHTSSTSTYSNQEGILIKIPSSSSESDALIYAVDVKITQFIKNGDNSYTEEIIYSNNSDTYFKTPNQNLVNTSLISSSYVNYMGGTYLKIIVNSPTPNRFYKYIVTDNFSDTYPITNIYGSEKIDNEMYSSVDIIETYENGNQYYYSTKEIRFKYNSAKDNVILTVTTSYTSQLFDLSKQSGINAFNASGYGKLLIPTGDSVVYTIVMYEAEQDMAEGIIGGEIFFKLDIYEAIENISSGLPYRTINFVTYNIIPNITLYGIENDNQNGLFDKGTMYGNEIKITFRQDVGRFNCSVFLQYEDCTIEQISSGKVVSNPATYTLIIKYTNLFTDSQYDTYLDFTISDNDEDFYKVVYKVNGETYYAEATGSSFTYTEGNLTNSIQTHYILNTTEFEILYNTEQGIKEPVPSPVVVNGYTTYIYYLTNVGNDVGSNTYFTRTIAITVVPYTNNILSNYSHYTNEGTRTALSGTMSSFVVSIEENTSSYKRIAWKSYYGIPENKVNVTIYFGDNQTIYTPKTEISNDLTIITLTTSGTYYLTFSDLAGNVHMFDSSNSTYTIRYLRSVIFTVNGESPINNAVYDSEVRINIPSSTSKYYDSNAQPKLSALRNGVAYTPSIDSDNRSYLFTETGLYKVWFSASVTVDGNVTKINEEPTYFLIIRPNESRWAFEFSEYADYYVTKIIKNDEDITSQLTNENMGNLTYKTVQNSDGSPSLKPYLKNFLISIYDALTGAGRYTVTINTGNEFNQEFTFSFWINNTTAPISVSIAENKATTSPIIVSFNTSDLIEDVGDCVLKITGYSDLHISSDLLEQGTINPSYQISLENANTYYIQLYSESGKLLYSYRVIKNEPLNTVSIIVIVVVSVVVVGLTILFILLRKRMKIK